MKSKDFVISELNTFVDKFTNVRVRYELNEMSSLHVVEVVPNEVYKIDEKYVDWENEMFEKFIDIFPMENICFITDDSYIKIENPIFEREGIGFSLITFHNAVRELHICPATPSFQPIVTFDRITRMSHESDSPFKTDIPSFTVNLVETDFSKAA